MSGQIFFAVLTFQLVMVGLLLIKGAPVLALLAALLPVLTVSYWRAADVLFKMPQEVLSLEAAVDLDKRDQVIKNAIAAFLRSTDIQHRKPCHAPFLKATYCLLHICAAWYFCTSKLRVLLLANTRTCICEVTWL